MTLLAHQARLMAGGGVPDPPWENVVSLLHFDGPHDSTTITDQKGVIWTRHGNARLSTTQSKWGPSSLYLDGTGDYLTTPDAADLTLAGTDVTIEFWARIAASKPTATLVSKRTRVGSRTEFSFYLSNNFVTAIGWNNDGVAVHVVCSSQLVTDTWYHLALSVVGNTWRVFVNGALDGVLSASGAIHRNSELIHIGRDAAFTDRDFNGYIDDFRWTKGVGLYTADFAPPTKPFPDL